MNKMRRSENFEELLQAYYEQPVPGQAFVSQLEGQLRAQPLEKSTNRSVIWGSRVEIFTRRRWAILAVSLALLVVFGVAAIGPQRVLAALRGMVGYVPGIGFVQTEGALALAVPVEETRAGITLRVEQVVAGPERTTAAVLLQGFEAGVPSTLHATTIRLPDQGELHPVKSMAESAQNPGEYRATFEYPALPAGMSQISLVWRLLDPTTREMTTWSIPLELKPTSDPQITQVLPEGYAPENALVTLHGITLRVSEVAHTPKETAVRLRIETPWEYGLVTSQGEAVLRDQEGNVYTEKITGVHLEDQGAPLEILTTPAPAQQTFTSRGWTMVFPGIEVAAKQMSLTIFELRFFANPYHSFSLDLGPNPQPDDSWEINETFYVVGVPVQLTRAHLVETTTKGLPSFTLTFDVALPENSDLLVRGIEVYSPGSMSPSCSSLADVCVPGVTWQADRLPQGVINLWINEADGMIRGPWEIEWEVPQDK